MLYTDEMTDTEARFIHDLHAYLDPHHPYDELSERQIRFLHCCYNRYCMGESVTWDDVDDLPLSDL